MDTLRHCRSAGILTAALLSSTSVGATDTPAWEDVYPDGGATLYCQEPFTPESRNIRAGEIYPLSTVLNNFGCLTSRQCADNPEFLKLAADLHNIYPVSRQEDLDRRGTRFSDLPEDSRLDDCGYRKSFQSFEPPDHAKGNVARTMLYMHTHHQLPLRGHVQMYQRWHELDPVDDEEQRRNILIKALQGNSNPFIDNPDLLRNFER